MRLIEHKGEGSRRDPSRKGAHPLSTVVGSTAAATHDVSDQSPPSTSPRDPFVLGRQRLAYRAYARRGLRSDVAAIGGFAVVALVGGTFLQPWTHFPALVLAAIWAPAAFGVMLLLGRVGLLVIGQGGLAAVAAYSTAYAAIHWHLEPVVAVIFGVVMSAAVAIATAPILRLRHLYFTIATFAVAIIIQQLIIAWGGITGGANGLGVVPPLRIGPVLISSELSYFYLAIGITLLSTIVIANLTRSRFGRGIETIRADPALATSLGMPVARYMRYAWIISAILAGISGAMFAYYTQYLGPDNFGLGLSLNLLAAVVVGGSAALLGPAVGVGVIFVLPAWLAIGSSSSAAIAAIVLVVCATVLPGGIAPHVHRRLEKLMPRRRASRATAPMPES